MKNQEVVLFAGVSAIAPIDARNFEAYTAWVASDDEHATCENDPLDEFYTTAYLYHFVTLKTM